MIKFFILLTLSIFLVKAEDQSLKFLIDDLPNDITAHTPFENLVKHEMSAFPLYHGTAWEFRGLIKPTDYSTLNSLVYKGLGRRRVYDRRKGWVNDQPSFLVEAKYSNGNNLEIIFNEEFKDCKGISKIPCSNFEEWIKDEAKLYAYILGQIPAILRKEIQNIAIHKGKYDIGGGNRNILLHTDRIREYINANVLEQMILHEATHNFDWVFGGVIGREKWLTAARADGTYISQYSKHNPEREDVTESIVPYMAVRYRPERFSYEEINMVKRTIPNRISLFDEHDLRFP
jgi:hypothetical protein